jgi:hypothetical protein
MPTIDTRIFAGMCSPGMRPLALTQLFRLWLTHHFEAVGRLENDDPSGPIARMVWQPNPATGIAIVPNWAWQPDLTERRPAVVIVRNDLERARLGINDKMQGMVGGTGDDRYENMWTGSHTLNCIGGDGAEAELLAAEVGREINQFAPVVRVALDLLRITVKTLGQVAQLPDSRVNWVVPIAVTYAYTERWVVRQQSPPLAAGTGTFSFS